MTYPIIKEIYRTKLEKCLQNRSISKMIMAVDIGIEYNTLKRILDPQSPHKWSNKTARKIKSFLERNERYLHE
jgi:hypothetical protein